jgi:hypothetical protein
LISIPAKFKRAKSCTAVAGVVVAIVAFLGHVNKAIAAEFQRACGRATIAIGNVPVVAFLPCHEIQQGIPANF